MARLVIDPVTRVGGHLRVEADVTGGQVRAAWSSGTMYRGIENMLVGPKKGLAQATHHTNRRSSVRCFAMRRTGAGATPRRRQQPRRPRKCNGLQRKTGKVRT